MVSLKDVAEHAGVSPSTVSRVLSEKPVVNENTRIRVMDAVRFLDYKPNELAKSLKLGRSNTIALMVPSIQNMIFPAITRGVEDTAKKAGYTVILCNTDEDVEEEKRYITRLRTRFIDGFIVASMLPGSDHIRKLWREGFPVVLTCRIYDDSIDAVGIDNETAAFEATQYLIRGGHKKIAFALGREEIPLYRDRFAGYRRALDSAGLPYDEELVIRETIGTGSFYFLTQNLIKRGTRPDAILASSDPKAFVVMRALHDAGLSIPDDVSVMGIDNVETSSQIEPPLSTVAQPLYEIGALAASKLIRQIQHKEKTGKLAPAQVDILKTDLIIRKSTR
ncbi:MAG: LacI family transcriptional regulator [Clostridiales bacterium]|nr:LacI family transcriptional regulator [Clostridiales bacterium]